MPYADSTYDAPATYSFTFEYLDAADIKVDVNNVTKTEGTNDDYTITNSVVTFNPGKEPAAPDKVRIYRATDLETPKATFYPGSAIRSQDLNANNDQVLFSAQETQNESLNRFGKNTIEGDIDAGGNRITNLANAFTGQGQNLVDNEINAYDDGDAASIGFVKHFFFDSGAETILEGEDWPIDSNTKIATTKAVDYRVDAKLQTALNEKVLADPASGITITDGASVAGQVNPITLGLVDGGIEIEKINPTDINAAADTVYSYANQAPTATTDWTTTDDQVATLAAIAKRHDGVVSNTAPSGTDYLPGTVWLSESGSSDTVNDEGEQLNKYLAVWNGLEWIGVAGGGTWINQNRLIWVDAGNGDDNNDGHRVISPMKTIQGAVNTAEDGDMIFVQPGVYSEYLPIDLGRKSNVSIIGLSMRSVFVHPNPTKKWNVTTNGATNQITSKVMEAGAHGNATSGTSEYETMFQLGSGSFLANMTIAGMKASGTRTDLATGTNSSEATTQGWFLAFADNDGAGNAVKFTKSPYVQNVTCFADSAIDNSNYQPHSTTNQPAFGGDQTSAITGGALLVDGNVPHADSPLRSFLTDAYTIICLDGPGVLVRNEGYAQLVSTFGHFCHYHAKAESGSMINMSNCTTDFGRFGLVADGQSSDSIFEGTVSATSTNNVIQIDATTAWSERNNNTPKPVNHMVVSLINNPSSASDYYPIKAVTEPSSGVYDIELYDNVSVTNDQTVYFYLRSTITTGGHVFEFAGAGTDYRAHPDNGGTPVEANQVKNEGAGKVYISSSDHNGNFKVGDVFNVSTDGASVAVTGTSTFNGNVTVGGTLDATTLTVGGSAVNSSATYFDGSGDIKDTAMPDKVTAGTSTYPDSVTVDAQGRVTAISAGTEPVTAVSAASGSAVSVTATKTPEVDIATFAGESQKGIVVNTATDGSNDDKFLQGDGSWADPAQASYSFGATTNTVNTDYIDLNLSGSSPSTVTIKDGANINLTKNTDGSVTIAAPNVAKASVDISSSPPTADIDHGDMWFDQNTGESYIYYDEDVAIADGVNTDAYWVQFAPQQRGTGNGTVTSVTAGTGLSGGTFTTTGTVALANTAVTIGTYGDANSVGQFTVDQQGRITGASNADIGSLHANTITQGELDINRIPALTVAKIPQFNAEKIQYTNSGTETNAWNPTDQKFIADVIPDIDPSNVKYDHDGASNTAAISIWDSTNKVFKEDTIPTLQKSKISGTGTWGAADIPDLSSEIQVTDSNGNSVDVHGYLKTIDQDSTPQLGANLDVNSHSIVSTSNGNVTLNPDGSGVVSFANNTGTTYVNGSYGVTIKPPTLSANRNLVLPGFSVTFPATDGTNGQYLKTDGSGNLSWGTDTTYDLTGANDGGDFRIRLSDSTTNDDVKLKAGTGVSLDNTVANECTITVAAVPAGAIMWWPGRGANIPSGWISCDGRVYKYKTAASGTYINEAGISLQHLRDALGKGAENLGCIYDSQRARIDSDWKNITVDANNPAPTFDPEIHFAVPDLRGEFIRGWDDARGRDTLVNRDLGSVQEDQNKSHTHYIKASNSGGNSLISRNGGSNNVGSTGYMLGSGGLEANPKNVAMIAIIKI